MDDFGNDLFDRAVSAETLEALARFITEGIEDMFSDLYLMSIGAI